MKQSTQILFTTSSLWWRLSVILFTGWLLFSCGHSSSTHVQREARDTLRGSFVQTDIQYAIGFNLVYQDDYKLLYVFEHYEDTQDTLSYLLLPYGVAVPPQYATYQRIDIPIQKIVTHSSTHLGLLDALDARNVVVGHSKADNVYNPKYLDLIASGQIAMVGRDNSTNIEMVISLDPDVLMSVGYPGKGHDTETILAEAGIPVIPNAEWRETSLLGRAEWIKLMAALLNKEALANTVFNNVVQAYDSLTNLARGATTKPILISGAPIQGTWYIPAGDSYKAKLFRDAGGDYPWMDLPGTGNVVVSMEEVLQQGLHADIWTDVRFAESREEIIAHDPRYEDFEAYQTGALYNFNKRVISSGANDYWETGVVSPHYILADFIKIIHPELLPDYTLFFYQPLK